MEKDGERHGLVAQLADGRYFCIDDKKPPVKRTLEKGTYKLYPISNNFVLNNRIRLSFDRPGADLQTLAKAQAQTQPVVVTEEGRNPVSLDVKAVGDAVRPKQIGMDCGPDRVSLVARVQLPVGARWRVENASDAKRARRVYLHGADGKCAEGDIDKGVYDVFVPDYVVKDGKTLRLRIEDTERERFYGDAPTVDVAPLRKPLWIPIDDAAQPNATGQPTPVAILQLKAPVKGLRFDVVSPGGGKVRAVRTDRKPVELMHKAEHAPGKIVLFVDDNRVDGQKDAKRWLLVRQWRQRDERFSMAFKRDGEPTTRPHHAGPSVGLPLPQRELRYVYPFLPKDAPIDELFLQAPKDLFVHLKRATDGAARGEPLLLLRYEAKRSTVLRATGEKFSVRSERLSDTPVEGDGWTWTFADNRTPTKLKRLDDVLMAEIFLPLSSRKKFASWRDKSLKLGQCLTKYMKKNDPAYGKSYDLVYSDTGANVSDVVFRRGRKKCGVARHDRKGEALIKKALKAEKKRQKKLKASVQRRFK